MIVIFFLGIHLEKEYIDKQINKKKIDNNIIQQSFVIMTTFRPTTVKVNNVPKTKTNVITRRNLNLNRSVNVFELTRNRNCQIVLGMN